MYISCTQCILNRCYSRFFKYKTNLCFCFADIDNSGYVSDYELQDLFKEASLPLPGYKVREIVEKIIAVTDSNKDGRINFEEFVSVRHYFWTLICSTLVLRIGLQKMNKD